MGLYDRMQEAAGWIRERYPHPPQLGIVLGSWLGDFVHELSEAVWWEYGSIPHFKPTSAPGHAGRLWIGMCEGREVAVLQGRCHYYEGYDVPDIVMPVRVLACLGVQTMLLTNTSGGINPLLVPGELMIISDHINLMGINPLHGENDERIGPRFPDMSQVYDETKKEIIASGLNAIDRQATNGIYAALSGPSYETPAEIRMLRTLGADAAGMSTVPEAIAARHMGVKVAGISCITNLAAGTAAGPLSHQGMKKTVEQVKPDFIRLLRICIPRL